MTGTIVVGIDGANHELVERLIAAGRVPTIERLLRDGLSGELESVLPPVTSPNWKAYATGKNPGKLGIFWWHNVDVDTGTVTRPIERYHDHREYWEIIGANERAGVLNVPTTYPPKSIDGIVVSGPPDANNSGFTHPPELERELTNRFDYRVTLQSQLSDGTREAYEEVLDLTELRFDVAEYLLDAYDLSFLHVTAFYVNSLHHELWDHEYTRRGWEIIDRRLADLLERDVNLVIMSDHGHAGIETVFNVNAWLERNGYLSYDTEVAETIHALGINANRLNRLLVTADRYVPAADLRDLAGTVVPQRLLNRIPNEDGNLGGSKHEAADWENTEAIASAQGPIYLTRDRDDPGYHDLREELVSELAALRGPDGRPIAVDVHRSEDVYTGPYVEAGPDIVLDKAPHVNVREGIGADEVFASEDPNWNGVNRREGLFAAAGPAFRSGTVDDLSILDLAPTLLALHDCPVPADMDGEIRRDVLSTDPSTDRDHRGPGREEEVS